MEHQTAKDTTVNEDTPINERGAYVADEADTNDDSFDEANRV